jgi:hypothetical protein
MTYELKLPVSGEKARTLTHIRDASGKLIASVANEFAPAIISGLNKGAAA